MRNLRNLTPRVVIHLLLGVIVASSLSLAAPVVAPAEPSMADSFSGIGLDISREGGPLTRKYPISHYALDTHVDSGILGDLSGVDFEKWSHDAAGLVWEGTKFPTTGVISLFLWAFSFKLLENGAGGIGQSSTALYGLVGRGWLAAAIILAGLWGLYKGMVRREYTQTAQGLGMSVVYAVLAMGLVFNTGPVMSQVSSWTDDLSNAILATATIGPEAPGGIGPRRPGDANSTKAELSDTLFKSFVYEPWVLLQFGGLGRCAGDDNRPSSSGSGRCVDYRQAYAPYWLEHEPGSDPREAEYKALKEGETPSPVGNPRPEPGQFSGRSFSDADKAAVKIQQGGQGKWRFILSLGVLGCNLGMIVVLGALAVGIILAQVLALLLLLLAPVMLILALIPGKGHDAFKAWLGRLGEALGRKVVYSLILALLLTAMLWLQLFTAGVNPMVGYVFQGLLMWMLFFFRKKIAGSLGARAGNITESVNTRFRRGKDKVQGTAEAAALASTGPAGAAVGASQVVNGQSNGHASPNGTAKPGSNGSAAPAPDSPAALSSDTRKRLAGWGSRKSRASGSNGTGPQESTSPTSSNPATGDTGQGTTQGTRAPTSPPVPDHQVQDRGTGKVFDQEQPTPQPQPRHDSQASERSDPPQPKPLRRDAADREPSPRELSDQTQHRIEAQPDITEPPQIVPPEPERRGWWRNRPDTDVFGRKR